MLDTLVKFVESVSDTIEAIDERLITWLDKSDEEWFDDWTDEQLKDLQNTITNILLNRMLNDSVDRDSA